MLYPGTPRQYFVYILTNRRRSVLYTGVTNDLSRRVQEHRDKVVPGFTGRYQADRLVYYEAHTDIRLAIAREKQIKAGSRDDKLALAATINPKWLDLALSLR